MLQEKRATGELLPAGESRRAEDDCCYLGGGGGGESGHRGKALPGGGGVD